MMQGKYLQMLMKKYTERGCEKTKPIKANFKLDGGFSASYIRDCHGPLGLAMTICGGFIQSAAEKRRIVRGAC